ncbi:hypothetical protein [Micromonospora globispora]|uniref:hypothetical protein n=1 Tax=Micromonospora globispora TaxID=1450148 RepID=UPI000F5F091D|nr:hypothetical protein [Micromonospora globispora]RQW99759.1 hypothetical protein DKL51_07870 [Micromonospora globispora]
MSSIEFYRNERGIADYRTTERRLDCLGMWLTDDIQSVHEICLDLLADLEDIGAGRKGGESWEGNAWAAELSPEGVDLQNLWRDVLKAHYPLPEARRVVAQYWRLLADDPDRGRAVTEWERDNGRPHPYGGL